MTIRLFRPVVVVFFLGLVGVTSLVAQDRTTDEWLPLLGNEDREVRMAAVSGLRHCGGTGEAKKVAPALVDAFKKEKDARVRYKIAWALGKMGADAAAAVPDLIAALADKEVAYRAAETLGEIGPAAKAAIPPLIAALAKPEITHAAAAALGKVGRDAMPALLDATKSKESIVRAGAAEALGELGGRSPASHVGGGGAEPAQKIVPTLSALLKDANDDVRYRAAAALKALGAQAAPAVPALVAALKDKRRDVRNQSAQALGRLGSAAVPALVEALADKESIVRAGAAEALGELGGRSPASHVGGGGAEPAQKIVPTLSALLKDANDDVRYRAAAALKALGAQAAPAVPALVAALKDKRRDVRNQSAQALGRLGSAAVPALVEALADKDACAWALKALASIGGNAKDAVAAVVKTLASDNADIRYEAIWVLTGLGADAQSGVPALEKIAKEDVSPENRSRATGALAAIKPPKKEEKKDEKKKDKN